MADCILPRRALGVCLGGATLLLLTACGSGDTPDALPFTDVALTAFSGVNTAREAVVQDEQAWAVLWAEHVSNSTPAPPRPAVDFTTQSVAGVFLGEDSLCRRPVIDKVEQAGARVRVSYRIAGSAAGEFCPAVVMTPGQIIRFANPNRLPIEFRVLR